LDVERRIENVHWSCGQIPALVQLKMSGKDYELLSYLGTVGPPIITQCTSIIEDKIGKGQLEIAIQSNTRIDTPGVLTLFVLATHRSRHSVHKETHCHHRKKKVPMIEV
jgi:hypothetical protein